jgi:hypothetical protein
MSRFDAMLRALVPEHPTHRAAGAAAGRSLALDPIRFDALSRRLGRLPSRRRLVQTAGGLLLAGVLSPAASLSARKRKKKRCRAPCTSGMVCKRGKCVCPAPQEACGGQCYDPCEGLPASGQTAARHPVTCKCCLRPGSYNCDQTGSLPCCAQACDPLAATPTCQEFVDSRCHEDVECFPRQYCPPGIDPRACADIPA